MDWNSKNFNNDSSDLNNYLHEFIKFVVYNLKVRTTEMLSTLGSVLYSEYFSESLKDTFFSLHNELKLVYNQLYQIENINCNVNNTNLEENLNKLNKIGNKLKELEYKYYYAAKILDTLATNATLATSMLLYFKDLYSLNPIYKQVGSKICVFPIITSKYSDLEVVSNVFSGYATVDSSNTGTTYVIKVPVYSNSDIYEWILLSHELGHVLYFDISGEKFGYEYDSLSNILLELKADCTAFMLIGPVYFETLMLSKSSMGINENGCYFTHPPYWLRIVALFRFQEFLGLKKYKEFSGYLGVADLINNLCERDFQREIDLCVPKGDSVSTIHILTNLMEWSYEFFGNYLKEILDYQRDIYSTARDISKYWLNNLDYISNTENKVSFVLAAYLSSKIKPKLMPYFTKLAMRSIISD